MAGKSKEIKNPNINGAELLYRISKAIASVKDGRELLKIIIAETQTIFGFYDIGLAVLDKSGKFFTDWSVLYQEISPSESNAAQRDLQNFQFPVDEPLMQYSIERVELEQKPFIENLSAEFADKFADFPHLPLEIEFGYKQYLVTTLKFRGETLGVFNFNSVRENHFDDCDFDLFQAIADLIAVAVANITAREEIIERTREKDVLLSISQAIATIQNHEQLLKVIFERIQPVFNFYDVGLFILSKDGKQVTDWAANENISPSDGNRQVKEFKIQTIKVEDSPLQTVINQLSESNSPLILPYDLNYLSAMTDPIFREQMTRIIKECGYREFMAATLKIGGKMIGLLFFNSKQSGFFQPSQFAIFQSVADQIAVAVANILANENILEREREKSVLLSISEDIAGARNAVELMQVIREKAQQLIPFYDTGILIVEENGECHYDLAVNLQGWDTSNSNQKLFDLGLHRIAHPDSYVEFVMNLIEAKNSPVIEDYEARFQEFDYPFFVVLKEFGYREGIGAALKSGGKTFGTLWLNSLEKNHFKPEQFEIFQALADQVAVAVSNILANDEIKRQLDEIKELKKRLEAENKYLVEEVRKNYNFEEIIGTSPRLNEVFEVIEQVAPTDATVLIQGETGTGKELAARAVHNRSTRNARPLIKINCAALPRELVESELFGHEKGSFTGAFEKRLGKFELADKGTIFLDEIGELPLEMQVKLLRVLQEKEIERLGGKGVIKLDLRVVAATNRNLAQEVQAGRFRADLYYRLCTVELFMPPLRERKEDIESLTMYFAQKYAAKFSRQIERISSKMLSELKAYDFPGNIRELEHIVEHAVIFSKNEKLILPRSLNTNVVTQADELNISKAPPSNGTKNLQDVECEHITEVLRQTAGRIKGKQGAAEILGLNPATVYFRMKKLGIKKNNL
jgi:formate hydrogenlyase transcriptional activator